MDDCLIFSRSTEEHEETVWEVLAQLRAAGVVFNTNKSKLFRSTIDFLGHNVSVSVITPIAQNTTKLSSFPMPLDKTALKCFLGLLNYYCRFMPGLASMVKPLTDMTSPKVPFSWTPACEATFKLATSSLGSELAVGPLRPEEHSTHRRQPLSCSDVVWDVLYTPWIHPRRARV